MVRTCREGGFGAAVRSRAPWAAALVAGLVATVALTGCGGGSSGNATATSAPAPAATTPAGSSSATAGTCGDYKAGQGGIIQVFCGGPATAKVAMGTASKELTGGTCTEQSGQLAINFGAVAGPSYPASKAKPDYLGALVDDSSGTLNAFTTIIDGVDSGAIVNRTATVSADKKSATLNGKRLSDSATVTVDVTC